MCQLRHFPETLSLTQVKRRLFNSMYRFIRRRRTADRQIGQRHLDYLKQHRKVTYINLLTSGRPNAYLADIDKQAQERFERYIEQMKQAQDNRTAKGRKLLRMERAAS